MLSIKWYHSYTILLCASMIWMFKHKNTDNTKRSMFRFIILVVFVSSVAGAPTQIDDDDGGFLFGTQSMECLKRKDFVSIVKRSAPEVSTIRYIHRVIYYRGQTFEWGNGIKGYHFGPDVAINECQVTWDETPSGSSDCAPSILEEFARNYRATYGGYNLVTNNCHHFVNRISAILSSENCRIGPDRWSDFSDRLWVWIQPFVAVFEQGTLDRPQNIKRAESPDPSIHDDWPIIKWY